MIIVKVKMVNNQTKEVEIDINSNTFTVKEFKALVCNNIIYTFYPNIK